MADTDSSAATETTAQLAPWLDACGAALGEVAEQLFAPREATTVATRAGVPEQELGAQIALVSARGPCLLGVFCSSAGCDRLTRDMLGLGDEDELGPTDVADAVGEIANMVAGGVKKRLSAGERMDVGLPVFIHGRIEAGRGVSAAVATVALGEIQVELAVLIDSSAHHGGRS